MLLRRLLPVLSLGLAACGSDSVGSTPTVSSVGSPTTAASATSQPAGPDASTTSAADITATPTTAAPPSLSYTLEGFEGLAPRDEPQLTRSSDDETITVWSSTTGITDAFIVLRDVPAPEHKSPEGDVSAVPMEVPTGTAFVVTDNVEGPAPASAIRVMWWRTDGRLWVVSNFGLTRQRLLDLTLEIQQGSGLPFVLPDPAMTFVGFSSLTGSESIRQEWSLDGSNLQLAVTTGGIAAQIGFNPIDALVERTVAGAAGFELTLPNGQHNVIWPTDNPDRWGSLTVSSALASRVDEIISAVVAR